MVFFFYIYMYPIHYACIVGIRDIIDIILSKSNEEVNRLTEPFCVFLLLFILPFILPHQMKIYKLF